MVHHLYIQLVSVFAGTFDVQNVSELTEEPPGNFCTQCIYVEGSKAKGCCIRLEEIGKETKAYRDETFPTCIQVANGGNYTLLVYDIEENETEVTSYSCYQNAKPAVTRDIIIRENGMFITTNIHVYALICEVPSKVRHL